MIKLVYLCNRLGVNGAICLEYFCRGAQKAVIGTDRCLDWYSNDTELVILTDILGLEAQLEGFFGKPDQIEKNLVLTL